MQHAVQVKERSADLTVFAIFGATGILSIEIEIGCLAEDHRVFFEPFDSRSAGGFHGQPRESREELGC